MALDPNNVGRLRLKFTDEVPYEATATGNPCRRPIEWLRTLYRRDFALGSTLGNQRVKLCARYIQFLQQGVIVVPQCAQRM